MKDADKIAYANEELRTLRKRLAKFEGMYGRKIAEAIESNARWSAMLDAMRIERDEARANARILAHAYEHDSAPPRRVVDDALAYPVDSSEE